VIINVSAVVFAVRALPEVFPREAKACQGQTSVIKCHYIEHSPLPVDEVVSWYSESNGILAQEGTLLEGIDKNKYAVADNGTWTILTIYNVTFNDAGLYACRTVNGNRPTSRLLVGNCQTFY